MRFWLHFSRFGQLHILLVSAVVLALLFPEVDVAELAQGVEHWGGGGVGGQG